MDKTLADKMIVVTMMTPGVGSGGGGWVIVGGKIKKIEPRSPSMQKLSAAVMTLEQIDGLQGVEKLAAVAKETMAAAIQELM